MPDEADRNNATPDASLPKATSKKVTRPKLTSPKAAASEVAPGIDANASRKEVVAATTNNMSGRGRPIDPTTCERDSCTAEQEFIFAMQEYKKSSGRMFPTWSEVLEVLKSIGYQKTQAQAKIELERKSRAS